MLLFISCKVTFSQTSYDQQTNIQTTRLLELLGAAKHRYLSIIHIDIDRGELLANETPPPPSP